MDTAAKYEKIFSIFVVVYSIYSTSQFSSQERTNYFQIEVTVEQLMILNQLKLMRAKI